MFIDKSDPPVGTWYMVADRPLLILASEDGQKCMCEEAMKTDKVVRPIFMYVCIRNH